MTKEAVRDRQEGARATCQGPQVEGYRSWATGQGQATCTVHISPHSIAVQQYSSTAVQLYGSTAVHQHSTVQQHGGWPRHTWVGVRGAMGAGMGGV